MALPHKTKMKTGKWETESDLLKSKATDLMFEQNRLKSFKTWPYDAAQGHNCTKEAMARAGFVYSGTRENADSAQCVICLKELDSWDPEDDPWAEHKSHAPHCAFVQLDKVETDWTVGDFLQMLGHRCAAIFRYSAMIKLNEWDAKMTEKEEKLTKLLESGPRQ